MSTLERHSQKDRGVFWNIEMELSESLSFMKTTFLNFDGNTLHGTPPTKATIFSGPLPRNNYFLCDHDTKPRSTKCKGRYDNFKNSFSIQQI